MISSLLFIPRLFGCAYPSDSSNFLGFPYWYQYLPGKLDTAGNCTPSLTSISDIWLIVATVIEILLRIAAIAAVVMIIVGGIQLISSQGEPNRANAARSTIINSIIGLVIAVAAAALVSFLAGQFS